MPIARLLAILVALALGVYRVFALRREGLSAGRALGVAFDRSAASDLPAGVFIGFAGVASIFTLELSSGMSRVTGVSSPAVLLDDGSTWIMVPFLEELVYRSGLLGGLLVILRRAPWCAILISAIVFGAGHALNQNATALAVVGSAVGGLAYGMAFAETGTVWLPVGLHFAWNYAQGPLFGFPLSGGLVKQGSWIHLERSGPTLFTGGSYGPEGGMIGLIGRAIVLALLVTYLWSSGSSGLRAFPNAGHAARVSFEEMRFTLALRAIAFVVILPGTVAGYVPFRILRASDRFAMPSPSASSLAAAALTLAGGIVLLRCVWDFFAAGRGTLAPIDPPKVLVVRGLYRFTRNPMYNGVLGMLLGQAWLFLSPQLLAYALAFFVTVHLFVVLYEERTLESRFGESYRSYRRSVPRWGFTTRAYKTA